ncbi:hypothetical protein CRUP_024796 [Coryphaenoides rupestris]|nr:hypothetical protein CRUP_024796 [Coryphaenoides rupestris]
MIKAGSFVFREEGDIADAMKELAVWRAKVQEAQAVTDERTAQAQQQEEAKRKAHEDMTSAQDQQGLYHGDCTKATLAIEFCAQIPEINLKFSQIQTEDDDDHDGQYISGLYTITQKPTTVLTGGQALITFEEKKVAAQLLKMVRCSVPCGQRVLDMRPKSVTLEGSAVKFVIQLDMSKKELSFSGLRSNMPQERILDRLECSFSRPSRGVADRLALIGQYCVDLDREEIVKVETVFNYSLQKFQTFKSSPERSILLDNISGVKDEEEEDVPDLLEIFFQLPTNSGGEIENLKYLAKGHQLALFDVI